MIAARYRFHGHASVSQTYKRGATIRGPLLTLKFALNPRRRSYRVAVVITRKVAKSAVTRNRIRRRLYEIIREQAGAISQPYDIVFTVFSDQLAELTAAELQDIVMTQLQKAAIVPSVSPQSRAIVKAKETEK